MSSFITRVGEKYGFPAFTTTQTKIPMNMLTPNNDNKLYRIHPHRLQLEGSIYDYTLFDDDYWFQEEYRQIMQNLLIGNTLDAGQTGSDLRTILATWSPESKFILNKTVNIIFNSNVIRNFPNSRIEQWSENVDRLGTSLKIWSRRTTREALRYGSAFTALLMPSSLPETPRSLADQRNDLFPILRGFTLAELVDWEVDPLGNLTKVMFIVDDYVDGVPVWHWYYITDEKYEEWTLERSRTVQANAKGEEPQLIAQGHHDFGFCPVIAQYGLEMVRPMIGPSMISDTVPLDFAALRHLNDLEFNSHQSMHSTLLIWSSNKSFGNAVMNNGQQYIKLEPNSDEKMEYLTPPNAPFDVAKDLVDFYNKRIAKLLNQDPLGDYDSIGKMDIAGIARQLSNRLTEERQLISLADRVEEFETRLLRMVHQITDNLMEADPSVCVSYPSDFSISTIDSKMVVYEKYRSLIPQDIKSWHLFMMESIAKGTVGDIPELHERISAEFKEYASKEPEISQEPSQDDELIPEAEEAEEIEE